MKKFIFVSIALLLCASLCFSESYKIVDVSYDMTGFTREYALSQKVPVDTSTVFADDEAFDTYLADLRQQLTNQRVFQSTDVNVTYLDRSAEGYIPVTLLITTVDTLNIIGVPYPAYNSNTGITLKIKVKDYNFLGSMETMDFDLNYAAVGTDALEDVKHVYGLNFGFSVPFNLIKLPASWNSNFNFSYTVGNPQLDMTIVEGIGVSLPIADITSANISFNQYYTMSSSQTLIGLHDDNYLTSVISFSLPFTVAKIPNWSNISWTPSASFSYTWDLDAFKGQEYGGIKYTGLRGPSLSFGHSLSAGRVNWIGNYRDGFTASLSQSFGYNMYSESESMSVSFSSQYFKKVCDWFGIATRAYWYKNFYNGNSGFGSMIRGIRDNDWSSPDFLLLNIDLPIKLFQTNWGALFGWDKLNFFNFEFQLSPFQDIVIGKNNSTNSSYSFKDAWYGTGIEMIVYPDRFRSIQGRISFGVDSIQFLQKFGNRVSAFNGLADDLFNTAWRTSASSWYELSIGIGLFY